MIAMVRELINGTWIFNAKFRCPDQELTTAAEV